MSDAPMTARAEDAARWFAKLRRGVMTVEERAAFAAWKRQRDNAAAMRELDSVWDRLQIAEGHIGAKAHAAPAYDRPNFARSALFAVMCAVSIGIGVLSYSGDNSFWTTLDWVER